MAMASASSGPTFSQGSNNHPDRTQARSMVITRQGIVATSEVLASQPERKFWRGEARGRRRHRRQRRVAWWSP